jgi:arylsulfatase A-like enzyme
VRLDLGAEAEREPSLRQRLKLVGLERYPPIEPLRPPAGAPNVLFVLIDDAGFGCSSAFGGPCRTPTADRLSADGLRFSRFHTAALCSPTRAALLSGRNHHTVGMGGITELATSAPGYNSIRPNTCAPLAETLKLNGYSTAQFGKCHEVPVWQTSPLGPFDSWPAGGGGFEYFYGCIGGETNQYYPALYEGTAPVEPDKTPEQGYHFTEDMTDRTIKWIRQQKSLMGDKPFFVYYAPGATHAPHHASAAIRRSRREAIRCGWSSRTTAAGSARAATSRSISTAPRSARAASMAPSQWSTQSTRPATSAPTPPRRSALTTRRRAAASPAQSSGIDIADAAEDLDHLISPDERLKIAMARQ